MPKNLIHKTGMVGVIISFPVTLVLVFLTISLDNPTQGVWLSFGSGACTLLFLTLWALDSVYRNTTKQVGTFVAIEVKNNRIYYDSECTGLQILSAENIEQIKIKKKFILPLFDIMIYMKNNKKTLIIPNIMSRQNRVIIKISKFANENGISTIN